MKTMLALTHLLGQEINILLVTSLWSVEQLNQSQSLQMGRSTAWFTPTEETKQLSVPTE